MRATKTKMLRRASYKMEPEKQNTAIDIVTRLFRIKSDVEVNWYTRRYAPSTPRAIYQKLKQQWNSTPRPLRNKVLL